jgi:hypothetical protein
VLRSVQVDGAGLGGANGWVVPVDDNTRHILLHEAKDMSSCFESAIAACHDSTRDLGGREEPEPQHLMRPGGADAAQAAQLF